MTRFLLLVMASLLVCFGTTWAGQLDDATAASKSGDYATAMGILQPLAEQGDASAQYNLGMMYGGGQGVVQDYKQATIWIEKAATQGNADAQYMLSVLYDDGVGVTKDHKQATLWREKAMAQGHVNATLQNMLLCTTRTASELDDGISPADVVAKAVIAKCNPSLEALIRVFDLVGPKMSQTQVQDIRNKIAQSYVPKVTSIVLESRVAKRKTQDDKKTKKTSGKDKTSM